MSTPKIFESEYRFCLIMWDTAPIKCAEIAKICKEKLNWSRTTTYTVIKRLGDRGVLRVESSYVHPIVSKEEAQKSELDQLMEKKFENSMPAFIAAFSKGRKLSAEDADALKSLIESAGK